jgi:hypothetical protein
MQCARVLATEGSCRDARWQNMTRDESRATSGGVPVTHDLVEQLVGEAEVGFDVAALRRRGGRRPLGFRSGGGRAGEAGSGAASCPLRARRRRHASASDVIRQALQAWLRSA